MDSKLPMYSHAFSQELHIQWGEFRIWLNTSAKELGFLQVHITDTDVSHAHPHLVKWLEESRHGQMAYMERHKDLRSDPDLLQAGAIRSICLTMPYLSERVSYMSSMSCMRQERLQPSRSFGMKKSLLESDQPMVSLYARERDYYKVIRSRLQILATEPEEKLQAALSELTIPWNTAFTDSAPLMEVELARKAGLGWQGKHTLLLNRDLGPFFS